MTDYNPLDRSDNKLLAGVQALACDRSPGSLKAVHQRRNCFLCLPSLTLFSFADHDHKPGGGLNLVDANLNEANLSGCELNNTDFSGADLTGVNLRAARPGDTRFTNTTFRDTNLRALT